MTATETLSTICPERIHDEALIALFHVEADRLFELSNAFERAKSVAAEASPKRLSFDERKRLSIDEVLALLDGRGDEVIPFSGSKRFADYAELLRSAISAVPAAHEAIYEHEKAYTGWIRFFLLTSSDGHVHRSTNCSTCNKGRNASTFALVASLSGTSVSTAVDVLGASLCSVCFPEAPVDAVDQVRIPARLANVLFDEGEAAFLKARDEAAAKVKVRCAGSGKVVLATSPPNAYRRYGRCPECNGVYGISTYNKIVAHKPSAD